MSLSDKRSCFIYPRARERNCGQKGIPPPCIVGLQRGSGGRAHHRESSVGVVLDRFGHFTLALGEGGMTLGNGQERAGFGGGAEQK